MALLAAGLVSGLSQPVPSFEVASVKVAPPRSGTAGFIAMDSDPAMIRYSNVTLDILIAIAYRFDSGRIVGGPAWLRSQAYEVAAKLPPATLKDQVPAMLRALLAERFKLMVHREPKEQRVYFLAAGDGGHKLKKVDEPDDQGVQQVRGERPPAQIVRGRITAHSAPVGLLAGALERVTGYQVVDRTGLTGTFDIDLKWTPEDANGYGPDIFAAIQEQLGLKLEPGRAPVEVLVIDHAERVPTED